MMLLISALTAQWADHNITRVYHALVHGVVAEDKGTIDAPIGRHPRDRKKMTVEPNKGKNAITHYRVLDRFAVANTSYRELTLETGRTDQIRVHMAYLGHPVLGDPVYGRRKDPYDLAGQALHAKVLGFKHPISGEYLEFDSPLPQYFEDLFARHASVRRITDEYTLLCGKFLPERQPSSVKQGLKN